jgi:hypothetical protein
MHFSTPVRAARANATESTIGTTPILVLLTGAQPANCAAAETGTRLAVMTLPSDWLSNPGDGTKALLGTWEDTSADAAGVAGYFRIYDSGGTVCGIQGSVSATGAGGELQLDNTNIATAQDVKVTAFTLTEGNA